MCPSIFYIYTKYLFVTHQTFPFQYTHSSLLLLSLFLLYSIFNSQMAAFSYQYNPFLVDHSHSPFMCLPPPSQHFHPLHQDIINCVDHQSSRITTVTENEPSSLTKNLSPQSSMVLDKLETGDEQVTQKINPMEKKRRARNNGPSSTNPKSHVIIKNINIFNVFLLAFLYQS